MADVNPLITMSDKLVALLPLLDEIETIQKLIEVTNPAYQQAQYLLDIVRNVNKYFEIIKPSPIVVIPSVMLPPMPPANTSQV